MMAIPLKKSKKTKHMKKLIAFIAVIGIVFSSCNGKYTIAKRKYNKGFYIAKSGNSYTAPVVAPKASAVNAPEEKVETVVVSKAIETPVASEINLAKESLSNEMKAPVKHFDKTAPIASASKDNYVPTSEIKPIQFNNSVLSATKGKSDGNLVLMVILCFFWWLNLIAVYMHDNGVTTNFWITLLLDFTLIGGIIFALLVVLDVVDLS
jgi:hypothetical protein